MKPEELRVAGVMAWAIVWSVIAVSLVTTVSNWVLLVGSGVLPPLMMLRMWAASAQTVPAHIPKAQ